MYQAEGTACAKVRFRESMGHVSDLRQFSRLNVAFQGLKDKVDQGEIMKGLAYHSKILELYSEGSGFKQGGNL